MPLPNACHSPNDQTERTLHASLARAFAPIVRTHPKERFYPVDLETVLTESSLYIANDPHVYSETKRLNEDPTPAASLANQKRNAFVTAAGYRPELCQVHTDYEFMPVPSDVPTMLSHYAGKARLTIYATVCTPAAVPNANLLTGSVYRISGVEQAIDSGLLINYYMFFPGMESPEPSPWLVREGDWAGVSLLVDRRPTSLQDLAFVQPVAACLWRKTRDARSRREYFAPGPGGLVEPNTLRWSADVNTGANTHPLVYVSLGRHNCYADAVGAVKPLKEGSPVVPPVDTEEVESGTYKPADPSVRGEVDDPWWLLGFLFPPLFGLACPARGSPPRREYRPADDAVSDSGPELLPPSTSGTGTSDAYPLPGTTGQLKLNVEYVDTTDFATRAMWDFRGSWGSAEVDDYPFSYGGPASEERVRWGQFGGAWRPSLSAWFMFYLALPNIGSILINA